MLAVGGSVVEPEKTAASARGYYRSPWLCNCPGGPRRAKSHFSPHFWWNC